MTDDYDDIDDDFIPDPDEPPAGSDTLGLVAPPILKVAETLAEMSSYRAADCPPAFEEFDDDGRLVVANLFEFPGYRGSKDAVEFNAWFTTRRMGTAEIKAHNARIRAMLAAMEG
jgi:hypothetical protein